MKKFLFSQAGVSLIEVIMGVGIMSVVGYGMMSMLSNTHKHQALINIKEEGRELVTELLEVSKGINCGIKDFEAGPIKLKASQIENNEFISLPLGVHGKGVSFTPNTSYGQYKIEDVTISPFVNKGTGKASFIAIDTAEADDLANAGLVKGSLSLVVSSRGSPQLPIRVPIYARINTTDNEITSCNYGWDELDLMSICTSFGGSWVDEELFCRLPCPPGLEEENDICVAPGDNTRELIECEIGDQCGVSSKYLI